MKNLLKVTGIVLLVLMIGSCSNGLLSTTYTGQNDNGKCVVTFNISKEITSRMILPDAPALDMVKHYKLSGESGRGESFVDQPLTVDGTTGKYTLSYSQWNLTLKAYDVDYNQLFQAETFIDLTYGTRVVNFTLSEVGVETKGKVSLSGTFDDPQDAVTKVKTGVYDINTHKLIGDLTVADITDQKIFSFSKEGLDPGEYVFKVHLVKEIDGQEKELAIWSDVVRVAPGRTTVAQIEIGDILGSKPTPPADLQAFLVKDSAKANGTYKVRLDWKDKSDNEVKFNIYIKEYSSLTEEGAALPLIEKLCSTTSTEIELDTGKLYDIQISAENYVGESDKVSRIAATIPDNDEDVSYAYAVESNARINLMKIAYDLRGGTYTNLTSDAEDPFGVETTKSGTLYEYKVYEDAPISLVTIDNINNKLELGTQAFKHWAKSADTTKAEFEPTNDWKNLSLAAIYNEDASIEIDIEGYKALADTRVSCTVDNVNKIYNSENADTKIDATSAKDIVITISPTGAENEPVFEEFKVVIDGIIYSLDDVNEFSINTSNLESGMYTVTACAKEATTNDWYSYQFKIYIAR